MINLRKIRYFLAAVDRGSVSAAALELGVSQPTLSQQLVALETHLHQKLLLRTPSGVTVTQAGRAFYRHAHSLAAQIERAEEEVGQIGGAGSGQVSLGLATCGAASTLALPLLRQMRREHPTIMLRLRDNFVGTLSEFIMTGRIDLALAYTASPIAGVNARALFVEQMVALVPFGMDVRGGRPPTLSLADLQELPMALFSPIHFLRGVVDRACMRAGFAPRVVAEIDSLPALLEAVAGGLGMTILPRAVLPAQPANVSLHRLGPEPVEATVSLCTSAQLPITSAIELVGTVVAELVQQHLGNGTWPGVRRLAG